MLPSSAGAFFMTANVAFLHINVYLSFGELTLTYSPMVCSMAQSFSHFLIISHTAYYLLIAVPDASDDCADCQPPFFSHQNEIPT